MSGQSSDGMKRCPNCNQLGAPDIWDNKDDVAEWSCDNSNCRVSLYEVPKNHLGRSIAQDTDRSEGGESP